MEKEGAIQIFLQSIEKRNLKYTVFVGDGDTDCFGRVHDECKRVHGDSYIVTKEECIGHVQKRLGTALRKYKSVMRGTLMADRKSAGGKGRLTDKVIDKMQNFFGQAIRNAEGDKQIMIKDIWAVLMHMVHENGSSLEKQYDNCPKEMIAGANTGQTEPAMMTAKDYQLYFLMS